MGQIFKFLFSWSILSGIGVNSNNNLFILKRKIIDSTQYPWKRGNKFFENSSFSYFLGIKSGNKVTSGHFFEGVEVHKSVKRSCLIPILAQNFRKKYFDKMSESNLSARKNFFRSGHSNKWAIVRGPWKYEP